MITIVEPKELVDKLWGKQKNREGETYRMMRYVLRVDHEDKVLLHNVVTGRLVVLEQEETEALANLPAAYSPVMEQLVTEHYLAPENYDEHQQVVNLRTILRNLGKACETTDITHYVILPTTACNARCYYCYQQGITAATMTEETADQVVSFIDSHCGKEKKVVITWFGGEPTVAMHRIDQICKGLQKSGILFESFMISNGYLFDADVIEKAKGLWNLKRVQITVDGTEKTYNQTKAFVNSCESPYRRVMRNIGLLLENGIAVAMRMNFDVGNWHEFTELVKEVKSRFHNDELLRVVVHQVLGEHAGTDGVIQHGTQAWFEDKIVELNDVARNAGISSRVYELPSIKFAACQAANGGSVVILPDGNLASCPEKLGSDQVKGNVRDGVTNHELVAKWKQFAEYTKCSDCNLFPLCIHMANCIAQGKCTSKKVFLRESSKAMIRKYDSWMNDRR